MSQKRGARWYRAACKQFFLDNKIRICSYLLDTRDLPSRRRLSRALSERGRNRGSRPRRKPEGPGGEMGSPSGSKHSPPNGTWGPFRSCLKTPPVGRATAAPSWARTQATALCGAKGKAEDTGLRRELRAGKQSQIDSSAPGAMAKHLRLLQASSDRAGSAGRLPMRSAPGVSQADGVEAADLAAAPCGNRDGVESASVLGCSQGCNPPSGYVLNPHRPAPCTRSPRPPVERRGRGRASPRNFHQNTVF